MTTTPPYLVNGDTIGIVCPSGYMPVEKATRCIETLKQWGFQVRLGKTLGGDSTNYFSGTDEERLLDLQQMLDDDSVKAILCGRGGYGLGRIIESVSFKNFKRSPKWIIGFSDITVLHAHIFSNYKIASLHGPMAGAFNEEPQPNEFTDSLRNVISGIPVRYLNEPHPFDRKGEATGELVGGNLTMLAHLVGSSSDIKTKGRILFLEDIGEYLYNIDRMLRQLQRADKLNKLAGLIIGDFKDNKDTQRPFGREVYEIIQDIVSGYGYPVCFGFPVGHGKENKTLKLAVEYNFNVSKNGTTLEEI